MAVVKKEVGRPAPQSVTVRIKLTDMGGYVVGDGPCPFDPDEFLVLFGQRMIDARLQGLEDLEIDPEELQELQLQNDVDKIAFKDDVAKATVKKARLRSGRGAAGRLLKLVEEVKDERSVRTAE
jgi:hypothetical protein